MSTRSGGRPRLARAERPFCRSSCYNAVARQEEFGYIAELLGDDTTRVRGRAADAAITAIEQLKKDIGIPARLHIRVKEEMLALFAESVSFKG